MADARGWCPVPNEILDRLMPRLRDTEFRLLCVVCRATLGRRNPATGKRRRRDWLSHAQLMRRTGRGSAAVSRALASLVVSGLVRAEGEDLRELRTARERRSHRGRVYLSICDSLWKSVEDFRSEDPPAAGALSPPPRRPPRLPAAVRLRRGWERAGRIVAGTG
ncbi:MAG: hypothetical protein ACO1SV_07430 [Fimbriimonas sp.]